MWDAYARDRAASLVVAMVCGAMRPPPGEGGSARVRSGEAFPVEALVAMTMTFGQGYQLERLEGIEDGHAELLDWIERWLASLEQRRSTA